MSVATLRPSRVFRTNTVRWWSMLDLSYLPGMREKCNLDPILDAQVESKIATCSGTFSNPKFMITLDHMRIDEGNNSYQDSKVGQ